MKLCVRQAVGPEPNHKLEPNSYFFLELGPNRTETFVTILELDRNWTEQNIMAMVIYEKRFSNFVKIEN